MYLTDIRTQTRSPMELGLSIIRWLPDDAWKILELRYGKLSKSAAIDEWLEDRQERYGYIGKWLAAWRLSMRSPVGELAALLAPAALTVHKFIDLCFALNQVSDKLQSSFDSFDNTNAIRLAARALVSDFFVDLADSGIGELLQLPNYPPALIEGKSQSYQRAVRELRSLGCESGNRSKPKRGRPKGTIKRSYPAECHNFTEVIQEAKQLSVKNADVRKLYIEWLKSRSIENTFSESNLQFQAGVVSNSGLKIGGKGKRLKSI